MSIIASKLILFELLIVSDQKLDQRERDNLEALPKDLDNGLVKMVSLISMNLLMNLSILESMFQKNMWKLL